MKVRLVDTESRNEIDAPAGLEGAVADYREEAATAPPGEFTTEMRVLVTKMEEIMGLERGKIKAILSTAWFKDIAEGTWSITLCFPSKGR